jgi:hypothetical protein
MTFRTKFFVTLSIKTLYGVQLCWVSHFIYCYAEWHCAECDELCLLCPNLLIVSKSGAMEKLQSVDRTKAGPNFQTRSGCMCATHFCCYEAKWPNLKLKIRPKQLLDSFLLSFVLPMEPSLSLMQGYLWVALYTYLYNKLMNRRLPLQPSPWHSKVPVVWSYSVCLCTLHPYKQMWDSEVVFATLHFLSNLWMVTIS